MRQRIELWKRIFDTDDNAISKTLPHLAWNLAAFTCLVTMVRHASAETNGKRLNGMMLEMLVSGFWSNTMQGIRRLAEWQDIEGSRGVCSLGGLIRSAKKVRHELTRHVFVEDIASLNYDYAATEGRYLRYLSSQPPGQPTWVPQEYDHDLSRHRHELFDWLSGTSREEAAADDVIREEVFETLERRLARLDSVMDHVNVQIAHAATDVSRQGRTLDRWGLEDAKAAIKELAVIAQVAGEWFCNSGIGTVLPHPQFNQFANLDQPFFAGDPSLLQQVWNDLESEIGQWHLVDPRAL